MQLGYLSILSNRSGLSSVNSSDISKRLQLSLDALFVLAVIIVVCSRIFGNNTIAASFAVR